MLSKDYNAKEIEKKWQDFWEKNNIYKFDPKSKKKIYSIDVPPPYASAGHLHVGHAFHYTQFEIIARCKRMQGYNVYFAPCIDNNGLPTEKYVEENLKVDKNSTSKKEFREICLKESLRIGKIYMDNVFKKIGHSYDWLLFFTTIDEQAQKITQWSFLDLYKKRLLERKEEPVIWCTHHKTALAQAEVEDINRKTKLNYIKFEDLVVATTRPELLSSCVGIFVNPKDKSKSKLIGKKVRVPLFDYEVKVMSDETVDPEFGTGVMMTCTFGDTEDIEKWKKYKLDLKVSINEDGTLNEKAGKYEGLSLEEARKEIIRDLKENNLLVKQEDLDQNVGTCWRCNTPIEFIVTKQWFIKTLKFKKELVRQGRKIKWHPQFYQKRYEDWVNNLQWDWCVSRQRFYGVPIPAWFCKNCGEIILPDEKDLPIDPEINNPKKKCKCGSSDFIPDHDVFDTWMTSSLTPELATRFNKKMLPMNLRPQSHDIIRTWAFYTILKSYYHFKQIPWNEVLISNFVLDSSGKGMSKSKGNAVWFDELNEKYDIDSIRFWVGSATPGKDLMYKEQEIVAGKKFITKLWNASKFSFTHLEDYRGSKPKLEWIDQYFMYKLNNVIEKVTKLYDNYLIGEAKKEIEQFFWKMFCDNYLEIVKNRLYNPDKRGKKSRISAQYTLYNILLNILKLMAPIIPHITEEIYQNYFIKFEKNKSIHISKWPKFKKLDKKIEKEGDRFLDIISKVRKHKSEKGLSLKSPVKIILSKKIDSLEDLKAVTNAEISFGKKFQII